jgi:hypothetical protein
MGLFCFKIPSASPLKKERIFLPPPFSKEELRRIMLVFYIDQYKHCEAKKCLNFSKEKTREESPSTRS